MNLFYTLIFHHCVNLHHSALSNLPKTIKKEDEKGADIVELLSSKTKTQKPQTPRIKDYNTIRMFLTHKWIPKPLFCISSLRGCFKSGRLCKKARKVYTGICR